MEHLKYIWRQKQKAALRMRWIFRLYNSSNAPLYTQTAIPGGFQAQPILFFTGAAWFGDTMYINPSLTRWRCRISYQISYTVIPTCFLITTLNPTVVFATVQTINPNLRLKGTWISITTPMMTTSGFTSPIPLLRVVILAEKPRVPRLQLHLIFRFTTAFKISTTIYPPIVLTAGCCRYSCILQALRALLLS